MAKKKDIWNVFNRLEGDKVVWIITMMLILFSVLCIFSSTSKLLRGDATRLDMVKDQLITVAAGLAVIFACYSIRNVAVFQFLAKFGFLLSAGLLIILDIGGIGPLKAAKLNNATRCLIIFGKQFHVFEVVKVAMVLYMSWAADELTKRKEIWGSELAKRALLIYLPFAITTVLIMKGSNSSAAFIALIMLITIAIGSNKIQDILILVGTGAAVFLICFGCYSITKNSKHILFERVGTAVSRIHGEDWEKKFSEAGSTVEMQAALDKLRQPYSAKIAIHQGGIIGKGPGQSTQRYVVPDMAEDYMYTFIIEEYGLVGGILVIILYVSLLARSAIIAERCKIDDDQKNRVVFARSTIAGLSILITGQAFMHMFVNVGIGPLTGQTLPLLSHGTSAFLCFCVAFGIILSISRTYSKSINKVERAAEPIFEISQSVESALEDLEQFENDGNEIVI